MRRWSRGTKSRRRRAHQLFLDGEQDPLGARKVRALGILTNQPTAPMEGRDEDPLHALLDQDARPRDAPRQPRCQVDARSCDLDHTIPYDENEPPGQTRPEKLACLCRRYGPYGTTHLVTDRGTRRLP